MESLKERWEEASDKARSWMSSLTGREEREYGTLIAGLDQPSIKDQSLILRSTTYYTTSAILGTLISSVAAYWACSSTFQIPTLFSAFYFCCVL